MANTSKFHSFQNSEIVKTISALNETIHVNSTQFGDQATIKLANETIRDLIRALN